MRSFVTRALSLALVVGAPLPALAQGLPTSQPPYILVIREDVKVGRGAEHARIEASWAAAFERAKSPDYYLGMESLTSTEVWFFIPSASYAELGERMTRERTGALGVEVAKLRRADGDVLNGWRGIQLHARPDLSGGTFPELGKQRHWSVGVYRMRPGGDDVFAAIAKAYGEASRKTGRTIGYRVYEVAAGMPAPTFFVFSSVTGFADLDKLIAEDESVIKEMLAGAVDEKTVSTWYEKLINSEGHTLSLSPDMSYVPAEIRAADPAFWKKPVPAKAAPAKPAATQP
jgi:hypothetical protein